MQTLKDFERRIAKIERAHALRAKRPLGLFAMFRLIQMESGR